MHAVEKGKVVSCQMSYFPIDSKEYLREVDGVLELIKESGLQYNVDLLSTTLRGESEKVFDLISRIHREMSGKNYNYTMNIMISNICGCEL